MSARFGWRLCKTVKEQVVGMLLTILGRYLRVVRFTLVDQDMGFSRSHDPRTAEPKVHSDRCRPARRLTKKRGRLSFRTKHFQLVPIRAYSIGCWLHIGRIREQAVHLAGNQQVLSTYRCSATASSKETVSRLPRVAADILPNSMSRSSRQGLRGIRSGSDRGKRSYNSDLRQAARGCLFASY